MSKTMNYVFKGLTAVAGLLSALMLICPIVSAKSLGISIKHNLFDYWDLGLKDAPADYTIMTICYSIVFFLGLILAVLALVEMFVDNKILNMIVKVLAIALVVIVIVGLVCNFVYVNGYEGVSIGAGSILTAIFSVATAGLVFAEKALK